MWFGYKLCYDVMICTDENHNVEPMEHIGS